MKTTRVPVVLFVSSCSCGSDEASCKFWHPSSRPYCPSFWGISQICRHKAAAWRSWGLQSEIEQRGIHHLKTEWDDLISIWNSAGFVFKAFRCSKQWKFVTFFERGRSQLLEIMSSKGLISPTLFPSLSAHIQNRDLLSYGP